MRRLVVLNFFPAFVPPKSGGELRLYHLYAELSRRFRIDLVSWTFEDAPAESVRLTANFTDHRVPKGALHRDSYECFARQGIAGELAGVSCALAARGDTEYHRVAAGLIEQADAVIHEFPYTLDYDRTIGSDGKPRIYNAHNVEADMARSLTASAAVRDLVFALERRLVAQAALVLATSPEERLKFHCLYGVPPERVALCPNGVAPEDFAWADQAARSREHLPADRLAALFLGSDHPPNAAAARFILDELAPAFPATEFRIAGSVCAGLDLLRPGNAVLLGALDAEGKRRALEEADLFLNPIAEGAGTSLKTLEAMAAGLPVLSTAAGVRGLGLVDGRDAAVAPLERFAGRLLTLLARPELRAALGRTARETALARFAWSGIAATAGEAVAAVCEAGPAAAPPRPLVLALNDYSVAEPVSGGALRIHRLLGHVARTADVVHLAFGRDDVVGIETLAPGFHEVRVPRTPEHVALAERVNHGHDVTVDDLVAAVACAHNPELVFYFDRLSARAAATVFHHPYLLPLLTMTGKRSRMVFDMHNVEAALKAVLLRAHRDADVFVPLAQALEAYGCASADAIVTVSAEDAAAVVRRYGGPEPIVVENGTDLCPPEAVEHAVAARERRDWEAGFTALFIGSAHPPNIAAGRFLAERVLPVLPEMRLHILGAVAAALGHLAGTPRLELDGAVSDERKRQLMLAADVALNPVTSGGGSNLKIPDYLAHGLPIVTTPLGARGFALDGAAIVAEPHEFPDAVLSLARAPAKRTAMARAARDAAQRLSWDRLGERFAAEVTRSDTAGALRVLVVTYRYGEPPPGGAEAYLARLLQALAATGDVAIDLMAPAVDGIVNLSRFIARATPQPASPARVLAPFLRRISFFPPDPPDLGAEAAACRWLFRMWQAESLALGRNVAAAHTAPLLLGGWNAPERHAGAVRRWSSGLSEIFVPRGHVALRLAGSLDSDAAILEWRCDDGPATSIELAGRFSIELALDPGSDHIVTLAMPAHAAAEVLIEIAFALESAAVIVPPGPGTAIDLAEDYETVASRDWPERWIAWAVETASTRSSEADLDFHALRGPHSQALAAALRRVAGDYDVVLVQGMPFGLAATAADAARDAGVPVVLLPHLHVEDRFYHWREHYRLIAEAAAVLTFSDGAARALVTRLGGHPVVIPGGGIDPVEFAYPAATERVWRRIHRAALPYFLVLGRKSGSKRCDLVIDAWRSLRDALAVDLVFIGADEGVVIPAEDGIFDYGPLPRAAVLGALAGTVALVTMSESESFGIVVLEAWMSGRPVIAPAGTLAFAELVGDGTDGCLVRDVTGLAAAMRRLATDPESAAAMGRRGRDRAERYSWADLAATLRGTLREAAGLTPGGR